MATQRGLLNPASYHLLCYGTLLGTEIFQSFVGGIVSYRALSRPQFSVLQQQIFPWYFGMQSMLPMVLALTYPAANTASPSGLAGVLEASNAKHVLMPLSIMLICGLGNWIVFGPATTRTIRERKHQETRDGKKYHDAGPHSPKMKQLNRNFSRLHGISSLINLVEIIVTVWYGLVLAQRL